MARQTFHFNASHLVNHCDTNPQETAAKAVQTQLCRSISELDPTERDLIRRLVENLRLLAESAPKRPAPSSSEKLPIPLVSIGPSGLKGSFQAEY